MQKSAQAYINMILFSNKSPRRYAASTLSGRLCANACSQTSREKELATDSAHQSRNDERNPCIVMSPRFMRLSTAVRLMSESGALGFLPGKTGPSRRGKSASEIADLAAASSLLGHTEKDITEKVYRRIGQAVRPTQ